MKRKKECPFLLSLLLLVSCSNYENAVQLLSESALPKKADYDAVRTEGFLTLAEGMKNFASKVSAGIYENYEEPENFVVSPLSLYMALSLLAEATNSYTREEILSVLDIDYDTLKTNFSILFDYLSKEDITSKLSITNSIWLQSNPRYEWKKECLDSLSENFYCTNYEADFRNNAKACSDFIKKFIYEKTDGLINLDLDLSPDTLFAIVNTLYYKDIWSRTQDGLSYTNNEIEFTNYDGTKTSKKFLTSFYKPGNFLQTDEFVSFYAETFNSYRLNFIIPSDGHSIDDVFTEENIKKSYDVFEDSYSNSTTEDGSHLYTRVLFPEMKAEYTAPLKDIFVDLGITKAFDENLSDFSSITDEKGLYASEIIHSANLEVTKDGIVGAAATVIPGESSSAPDKQVYQEIVVDKAFGFTISGYKGITLFSGVVKKI